MKFGFSGNKPNFYFASITSLLWGYRGIPTADPSGETVG
jgi:hypothetical protein